MAGLAEGLTNREIAKRMGVTDKTVKIHIANLFNRFGVDNRTKLALIAHDMIKSATSPSMPMCSLCIRPATLYAVHLCDKHVDELRTAQFRRTSSPREVRELKAV
jgi:regulatory LuxR family protein